MIVGTAALVAVAAVFTLAVATIVRRSAAAVTIVFAAIVVPYFLSAIRRLPAGLGDWLLRVTPAAAFAVQQATPRYHAGPAAYYAPVSGSSRSRRGPGSRCCAAGRWSPSAGPPTCCAGGTREPGRPGQRTLAWADALHAEWTKLRTLAGTGWLLVGRGRAHRRGERGGGRRGDLPGRRLPGRPGQAQPDRRPGRPGDRGDHRRAGDQQRVQHRHDPGHADGDAAPVATSWRQGRPRRRPGAGGGRRRRAGVACWPGG